MDHLQAQIIKNGDWVNIPFMDLKKGTIFRLLYPDGTVLTAREESGTYSSVIIAKSDAYINKDGQSAIDGDVNLYDVKKLK